MLVMQYRKDHRQVVFSYAILINVQVNKEIAMSKYCPHCHSITIVKFGTRNGRQRYRCKKCGKVWQNKSQTQRLEAAIWYDYAVEDLRIKQLCERYAFGDDKIRSILSLHRVPSIIPGGRHDVIGMDCTYFGRRGINEWGLLIVIDLHTEECLYCEEIPGHETWAHYCQALDVLADFQVYPKACVIDGITGLAGVLGLRGLAVQYCQFHQIKTINSYLTRNPVLEPNNELRKIALSLTHIKRQTFIVAFNSWFYKNKAWLNEKTRNPDTGRLEYSHQKTRSAVHSLQRNFKYLYTFEQHPELNIPNTNNMLEGINSAIKSKLNHHRGAKKDLKLSWSEIFSLGEQRCKTTKKTY